MEEQININEDSIIIDKYEHGYSMGQLAKEFHHGQAYIKKLLIENNIHLRSASENAILKRVNYQFTLEDIEKKSA